MDKNAERLLRSLLKANLDAMPFAVNSGLELFRRPIEVLARVSPMMTMSEVAVALANIAESTFKEILSA